MSRLRIESPDGNVSWCDGPTPGLACPNATPGSGRVACAGCRVVMEDGVTAIRVSAQARERCPVAELGRLLVSEALVGAARAGALTD